MKCKECKYFIPDREFCAYYMEHTYSEKTMDCDEEHPEYQINYNMSKILSKSKPLPCCARCKKWGTDNCNCKDSPASFLCHNFDNDGTAETTHYDGAYRGNE